MLLQNLNVVLARPRFPENIGMLIRACLNMGCANIFVVNPEIWKPEKILLTATPKGEKIFRNMQIFDTLEDALAKSNYAWGATARTGGWRRDVWKCDDACAEIARQLAGGGKVALVLGNEKSGLSNMEISQCTHLLNIHAYGELNSLNIAQAALIILYECAKMAEKLQKQGISGESGKQLDMAKLNLLEAVMKETLGELGCRKGKNPDYYFTTWHKMFARLNLRPYEFDVWMGFFRRILRLCGKK